MVCGVALVGREAEAWRGESGTAAISPIAGPECTSRDERLGPKMREAEDGRYKQPANFAACIVNVNKE